MIGLVLLPDNVLQLILSFLNTKFAVQTCVLSKRWMFLWTGIPALRLNCHSFLKHISFVKFVTRVFLHRDKSKVIRQFELSYSIVSDDDPMMKLMFNFLELHGQGVEHLVINYYYHEYISSKFHPSPFWNPLSTFVSLKTPTLEGVRVNVNMAYYFASLESLLLKKCRLANHEGLLYNPLKGTIKITAPQLKDLELDHLVFPSTDEDFKMIVDVPKLYKLYFSCTDIFHLSIIPTNHVLSYLGIHYSPYFAKEVDYRHLVNTLAEVGNANYVCLSHPTVRVSINYIYL